jgi:hypothetical protein
VRSAETARRHLDRLAASPRPAGSVAETAARGYSASELAAFGFSVAEEPFEYSTLPGRWATPVGGLASMVGLAAAGHLGSRGYAGAALGILVVGIVVGTVVARWVARRGVTELPMGRTQAVNLRATRGSSPPRVWLVAHLDSKSQPVSMAARVGGIVGSGALWLVALGVAVVQLSGSPLASWWAPISILGALAGLPVAASLVGRRSPGALDNASGVATVLMAAASLERSMSVGVLLTSAEELGLAGARAWSIAHPAALAINCDGVDDIGALTCMYTGRRSSRVVAALEESAGSREVGLIVRRLIPGLLVDAVALRDAGWDCATISRGTWRTLSRIHSPRDRADRLTGAGIAEAAAVVADAVARIVADGPIFRAETSGPSAKPSAP